MMQSDDPIIRETAKAFRRNRRERWIDYAIGGVFIAILFTIAMLIVPMIPVALRPPPVHIISAQTETAMPVCPEDRVWVDVHLSIEEPAIIGQWSGMLVTESEATVPHTRMQWTPIVRDRSGERTERIFVEIPEELEAGEYVFISAWAAINSDTKPEFIRIPITVGEDCFK